MQNKNKREDGADRALLILWGHVSRGHWTDKDGRAKGRSALRLDLVLFPDAHELLLFGGRLEAAVAELGGGVDELGRHLLQLPPLGRAKESLPDGDDALFGAHDSALDHEVVLVDLAIMWEATHRSDALLREIELSRGVVVDNLATLLADPLAWRKKQRRLPNGKVDKRINEKKLTKKEKKSETRESDERL